MLLPVLHEAVKCLQWFQCVSLDREAWRRGSTVLQDKELQEEVTGESTSLKKRRVK